MVFMKRQEHPKAGYDILTILGKKETEGQVGLEIEVEGNKFEKTLVPAMWKFTPDGSLRGHDNAEYLLKKPVMFSEVEPALDALWGMFRNTGSILDESNRTSVHVHLNAQTFHLNRLTSFLAMYFCLEEILTEWCGEFRVGNLFCLRAKDAPAIVGQIKKFIQTDGKAQLSNNIHHYAALNAAALFKFGSIEIRTLRGATDPVVIRDWVRILERIYNLSAEFDDPRAVCDIFSGEGPLAFFETLLGDMVPVVRGVVSWPDEKIRESMYEGIRLAQDLCYCRDWDQYKPMRLETDPFGRDPRKIATKLAEHPIIAAVSPSGNTYYTWAEPEEATEDLYFELAPEYGEDEDDD